MNNENRWQAVITRNPALTSAFVFAVESTGIYCLPGCASRTPKRENVRFFATPGEAEKAGFRACKRCHPAGGGATEMVERLCALLSESETLPNLATLAAAVGLSPGHVQRVFKAKIGLSPKQYALAHRKQRLRAGLSGASSVTAAIYDAGYETPSRAYEDAADFGVSLSSLTKGASGEVIRWAMTDSSLGRVGVAATQRGLCMIEFADEPAEFVALLHQRFPKARIDPGADQFGGHVAAVVALIDDPRRPSSLPLDLYGTAFQERVWRALTLIPPGETVSYTQLAERLGQPRAARAVARACATNVIAVAVPCHRVIRGSGDLAGYKWGLERKRALLMREKP